jgi:uncharacterized ferredoxin-like protein
MTKYTSDQAEKEAARMVAMLMAASARTAPKTRGLDSIKTLILEGEDVEKLAAGMERKGEKMPSHTGAILKGNASNVRVSSCVLLIGVSREPKKIDSPLDCGACGYGSCQNLAKVPKRVQDFNGPTCMFQAMDLGIALGSAVKTASECNIDNRMMYSIGVAAKEMQLMDSDLIIGIPLSVSGKSPYFDRSSKIPDHQDTNTR